MVDHVETPDSHNARGDISHWKTVFPLRVTVDSKSSGFDFLRRKCSELTSLQRNFGKRACHAVFKIRIDFQYDQRHQITIVTIVSGIATAARSQACFDTCISSLESVCTNWDEKKFLGLVS